MQAASRTTPTRLTLTLRPARRGLFARLAAMRTAARTRRALDTLDDHVLRDIGITREEAMREARRPAWDVPPSWLR